VLIPLDLDRAMRDPRDLEDLIDLIEQSSPRIPVESVSGSLRLANDADVTVAQVMCAVANKASRDTARRASPPPGATGPRSASTAPGARGPSAATG
jgi:site-specific DNA recombinase